MDALLAELIAICGPAHVLTDPDVTGIGRAKAAVLHLSRSAAEIAAMRAVKSALDLAGLLNPGVLFLPPGGRPHR